MALLGLSQTASAQSPSSENGLPLVCWTLPSLMARFQENHVSRPMAAQEMRDRIVELYEKRLDPSKILLLKHEHVALRTFLQQLVKEVEMGRCEQLGKLRDMQQSWHGEMEKFVGKYLSNDDLEIDKTISLQVDPDKRERPTTEAQRAAIRQKLIQFQLVNYISAGTELEEAKEKLKKRYALISRRIKESKDADDYSLHLNIFASALDPHSSYFSKDDLEDFRINMGLSLEGIGAVLQNRDGYTTIHKIIAGGPAERDGRIKPKDKIVAVTQLPAGEPVNVIDMMLRDVVKLIRGKKGTKVKLTVLRTGKKNETLNIVIKRDKIDLKEQAAKLSWHESKRNGKPLKIAVIDLPSFYGGGGPNANRDCVDDVRRLVNEAKIKKADGLLLDLSQNGGGLLRAAVDLSGLFVASGPIVAIEGRKSAAQYLQDRDEKVVFAGPMGVLVSRASASASEIVAGALKDYDRALIIGDEHTFGKGTVQNIVDLPPGLGAIKVTTALFYRPDGASTQNTGVRSDIIVSSEFNRDDHGEKHQPYALEQDAIKPYGTPTVNVTGETHWVPVTKAEIKALATKSRVRVANNEALQKIQTELNKYKKNKGIITLKELLDDDEKAKKDDEDEDTEKAPPVRRLEAAEIVADLVTQRSLPTVSKTKSAK
jgi:carboxyl-terminal processing protease